MNSTIKHKTERENSLLLLHVRSGMATQAQIESGIMSAINIANSKLRTQLETDFELNVATKKEGDLIGHSFLHVIDPRLANVLRGYNPDGTIRCETIAPSFEEMMNSSTDNCSNSVDIDLRTTEVHQEIFPPIRIEYSKEQSKIAGERGWETEGYTLTIGWSEVKTTTELEKNGDIYNILNGRVPGDMNNEQLHNIFNRFNTSENTFRRGHEPPQLYPVIERRGDNVDIIYDHQTNDAQVAAQMRRKFIHEGHTLFFDHKKYPQRVRSRSEGQPQRFQHGHGQEFKG